MDQHLTIVDHPLVQHKLTLMRDTATSTAVFRQLLREISQLLAYAVTRNLPMSTRQIETPLMTMDAPVIGGKKLAPAYKGEATARVSTRNVMPKTAKTLGLAGRYIQVEAYVRTANADRAHKRLAQVGLPVEHRVVNRNGSQLNLILAGPF